MKKKYLECECSRHEHIACFSVEEYEEEEPEVVIGVQLYQYRNFFHRLWVAIRYLFGYESRYGHWDCLIVKKSRFREFVDELLDDKNENEKRD